MTTDTKSLDEWLVRLGDEQKAMPVGLSLGLERVADVAKQMALIPFSIPTITIAGTNGKGSTVALLEAMLVAHGYRVGSFTSPHIFRANERIRLNGEPVSDELLIDAFTQIESYQFEPSPTYFEWFTLAALSIFKQQQLDYVLLEVGLGGRLDAVNIISPLVAVVTSIGLDHQHILGDTREAIALEKAGIFRKHGKAVCGCLNPPKTLIDVAKTLKLSIDYQTRDFKCVEHDDFWDFISTATQLKHLPKPRLALQNAATAIKVLCKLPIKLEYDHVCEGLKQARLIGRQEWIPGKVNHLYDVAHNLDSIKQLTRRLATLPDKVIAVFSMFKDKPVEACIALLKPYVKAWFVAPLESDRTLSLDAMRRYFERQKITSVIYCESISQAYDQSLARAKVNDTILITGSFLTVGMTYKSGYTGLTVREKVV